MADRGLSSVIAKGGGVLRRFPRLPWERRGPVTALDVDGHTMRMVQAVHRFGESRVMHYAAGRLELPEGADITNPVLMGAAIARTLERLPIKASQVVMSIPRAMVVMRTLTLPSPDDPREIAAMVHFQMARDLPFPLEDAVIDFKVQPAPTLAPAAEKGKAAVAEAESGAQPKVEVLVAAVRRELVQSYLEKAAAAGLKLAALGLRSYANARCVESSAASAEPEGVALVSLRPDEVLIDVAAGDSLLFSRVASVKKPARHENGSQGGADHAPENGRTAPASEVSAAAAEATFASAVTMEVVRSLHSYGAQSHRLVTRLLVAGVTGDEPAVVEALQKRFTIPCSLLDPSAVLGLTAVPKEEAPGAVAAVGLALGAADPEGLPFDFLNPKRPRVQRNTRRIKIIAGVTAAVIAGTSLFGVRTHLMKNRLAEQAEIQEQIRQAEQQQPAFRRIRLHAKTVQDWSREERKWLDHYAYLSAVLPAATDVYVTSLSTSSQGRIRFSVQARSGGVLAQMDKQLRTAGYEVKPLAITPARDKFGYPFKTTVELEIPGRMKIDLAKISPPVRPEDDPEMGRQEQPAVAPPNPAPATPAQASAPPSTNPGKDPTAPSRPPSANDPVPQRPTASQNSPRPQPSSSSRDKSRRDR